MSTGRIKMVLPGVRDYPQTLEINDIVWDVKFVRKIGGEGDILGLCDPSNNTIYIRLKQSRKEMLKTFIHELLHAFEESYGIKIPHRLIYKLEVAFAEFIFNHWGDIFKHAQF